MLNKRNLHFIKKVVALALVLTISLPAFTAFASDRDLGESEDFILRAEYAVRGMDLNNYLWSFDIEQTLGEGINVSSIVSASTTNLVLIELDDFFIIANRDTGRGYFYESFSTRLLLAHSSRGGAYLAAETRATRFVQCPTGLVLLIYDSAEDARIAHHYLSWDEDTVIAPYIYAPAGEMITLVNYSDPQAVSLGIYLGFLRGWEIVGSRSILIGTAIISAVGVVLAASITAGSNIHIANQNNQSNSGGSQNNNPNNNGGWSNTPPGPSTQQRLTLTVTAGRGGHVFGNGTFNRGDWVTIQSQPASNDFRFIGWYRNGVFFSASPTYGFYIQQSQSIEARFVQYSQSHPQPGTTGQVNIFVTTTPSNGGTVEGAWTRQRSLTVNRNSQVSLRAVENSNANFVFQGWFENGVSVSRNPVLNFTAENDRALEARFVHIGAVSNGVSIGQDTNTSQHTRDAVVGRVMMNVNNSVYGQISVNTGRDWVRIQSGTAVTPTVGSHVGLTAIPASSDSVFSHWTTNSNDIVVIDPSSASTEFHISPGSTDPNMTITAHFR
ncbi:MAG: hypothetical protein FWC70_11900 [Defluviitaleaceae bacterium]|nr:hypothetical protein [Defluviitaleaceae bacterium]